MPFCISIAQRNGIDDVSELYEDAVTRPLDDAAVMHGDGEIDQIASQRSEAGKCPLLVGPGKLAESDHIRRKAFAGRELNPLDHVERFQIIFSSPSPGFFLA
jgi:hypothetical protein